MRHFEIVPRTLEGKSRRIGPKAGPANVRYDSIGRLSFSKLASVIFEPHTMVIAGYDRDAQELCFTAVDKPPQGYTEAACYGINWIKTKKKGTHSHCILAVKSLFQKIGFYMKAHVDFPIVSMDEKTHSVILAIPAVSETTPDQETIPARSSAVRPNGEEHAAA